MDRGWVTEASVEDGKLLPGVPRTMFRLQGGEWDGKEVARKSMEHTTPVTFPEDEAFDIGQDTRTGVALLEYRYDVPFKFTGKINKLTFNLGPHQVTAEEREQMQETVAKARD